MTASAWASEARAADRLDTRRSEGANGRLKVMVHERHVGRSGILAVPGVVPGVVPGGFQTRPKARKGQRGGNVPSSVPGRRGAGGRSRTRRSTSVTDLSGLIGRAESLASFTGVKQSDEFCEENPQQPVRVFLPAESVAENLCPAVQGSWKGGVVKKLVVRHGTPRGWS